MKICTIFILLLALTGCGTANDKAPEFFDQNSDKGLVIGTITFEGDVPVNDIYRFFYEGTSADRKFNKRNAGKVMFKARNDKNQPGFSGDFNNAKTYLFVLELEPGSYAFTQYNYLDHIGPTGMVHSSKTFSIPFEAAKGQIAYIGEMAYKDKAEQGVPRIFVSGYYERDIAEFSKKFPKTDWDKAVDKTVKSGNSGGGIVEFR